MERDKKYWIIDRDYQIQKEVWKRASDDFKPKFNTYMDARGKFRRKTLKNSLKEYDRLQKLIKRMAKFQ